jgi:hypothetical protein
MVFARRRSRIQRAKVEIGYASSGFLQFVAMAFRLLPYAPRTQIRKTWLAPRTVRSPAVKPALIDVG